MSKVLQNNKATISLGRVELFCLFVTCSYTSMEATVLSCCFSWVWSGMLKVIWSNKSPISLERVEWFCWFFASSYLHLVRYPLKLQNYAIWASIFRYRLSVNQIDRCLKPKNLKKRYEVSSWFFASIEARRNIMLFLIMTSKYSWPISLQDFLLLACLTC